MNEPLGVLATPYFGFAALVLIGGLAGYFMGKIGHARHWFVTLILIGVAGSWLGSEIAVILDLVVRGSGAYFIAALLGAMAIIGGWQKLHPE